jgi:FtsZ-interacting cell division protein YlmF
MALNKLKKFVTEEVMDEVSEDEYYDAEKIGSGKMILLEPRAYSESQQIADYLKSNSSVVVNLRRVTPDQAKRIVDFLSGTLYAVGGDLQKLGGGIFLCTPNTVNVEGKISDEGVKGKDNKQAANKAKGDNKDEQPEEDEFNW